MISKSCKFAVLFDFDGVLIDSYLAHQYATIDFCKNHGIRISKKIFKNQIFGKKNEEWLPYIFKKELSTEEIHVYGYEKESIFMANFIKIIKPIKGVQDFIRNLEKYDIEKCIVSSADLENIIKILSSSDFDLLKYFKSEQILSANDVCKGKPQPDIYLRAAEKINYKPERCIAIEDTMIGIIAGKKAGCKVIGLATTNSPQKLKSMENINMKPDFIAKNYESIPFELLIKLVS